MKSAHATQLYPPFSPQADLTTWHWMKIYNVDIHEQLFNSMENKCAESAEYTEKGKPARPRQESGSTSSSSSLSSTQAADTSASMTRRVSSLPDNSQKLNPMKSIATLSRNSSFLTAPLRGINDFGNPWTNGRTDDDFGNGGGNSRSKSLEFERTLNRDKGCWRSGGIAHERSQLRNEVSVNDESNAEPLKPPDGDEACKLSFHMYREIKQKARQKVFHSLPTLFTLKDELALDYYNINVSGKRQWRGSHVVELNVGKDEDTGNLACYIHQDMSVMRLNAIQKYLWLAGRPIIGRPLHRQIMLGRKVILTEQADLHYLVSDGFSDASSGQVIYLKPLPIYLVNYEFFRDHICKDRQVYQLSVGFLLTYVWLIRSELDFNLACELNLLPRIGMCDGLCHEVQNSEIHLTRHCNTTGSIGITWEAWKEFSHSMLQHLKTTTSATGAEILVNPRYQFGELRLDRINTLYRVLPVFFPYYFIKGYLYEYNRCDIFFQRRIAWMLVLSVWVSVVLSALEVWTSATGTTISSKLPLTRAVNKFGHGFVIFALVTAFGVAASVIFVYAATFAANSYISIKQTLLTKRRMQSL